jgi:hypothetical protein
VYRMTIGDARLVAMLTLLRDRLGLVVDEITFGELSTSDRRELADALRRVADALEREPARLIVEMDQPAGRRSVQA